MDTAREEKSMEVEEGVGGKRRGGLFFNNFDKLLQKKSNFFLNTIDKLGFWEREEVRKEGEKKV